jgi:hypothetical protein
LGTECTTICKNKTICYNSAATFRNSNKIEISIEGDKHYGLNGLIVATLALTIAYDNIDIFFLKALKIDHPQKETVNTIYNKDSPLLDASFRFSSPPPSPR